mgnify:CR=1 FL=1
MSWILMFAIACGTPEAPAVAEPAPSIDAPVAAPPVAAAAMWSFKAQDGWTAETVTSKMRLAQFSLPKDDGDPEDASLVVYFFGEGGGGGVEPNFQRWAGQFVVEGQDDPLKAAELSKTEREGVVIHHLRISGNFIAETRPGSGDRVDKKGWRMLASVVETQGGPYFIKLTGPEKTVNKWAASYETFLAVSGP